MQNPWQGLVWWVDEVYSTEVQFVGDDLYNRGNLRDMVHNPVLFLVYESNGEDEESVLEELDPMVN